MSEELYWPDWLEEQRGLTYNQNRKQVLVAPSSGGIPPARFKSKFEIVRRYVSELEGKQIRVTHQKIRTVLERLGRNYKTDPQSISRAIHGVFLSKGGERYANGHRVRLVEPTGEIKIYKSLNEAAEREGRSPQSVLKWASSGKPNRRGQSWSFVDPPAIRSRRRPKPDTA